MPKRILMTCMTIPACVSLAHEAAVDKVVKVYILAGQSNVEGKGMPCHLDTYKDDLLIKPWYDTVKDGDQWPVRDDVFITYP